MTGARLFLKRQFSALQRTFIGVLYATVTPQAVVDAATLAACCCLMCHEQSNSLVRWRFAVLVGNLSDLHHSSLDSAQGIQTAHDYTYRLTRMRLLKQGAK